MKRVFTLLVSVVLAGIAAGQQPESASRLVTGNDDVISQNGWIPSHQIVQSGPNSFFWIGGSRSNSYVDHPLLEEVDFNYANTYFIRYDENGDTLDANFIRGTNSITGAFSFNGGLTLMGVAYNDVETDGNQFPIRTANKMEFLAQYDDKSEYLNLVPIWDLGPSQYPNSVVQMDNRTGTIYVAGASNQPLNLVGKGMIGADLQEYLYVIKYDRNLGYQEVFTAGFDNTSGVFGTYEGPSIAIIPDASGNVVVTGGYRGDRTPVIADVTLTNMMGDSDGLFAVKLDGKLQKVWVREGNMKGSNWQTGIVKGFAMENGDLVLTGVTSTGYFKLGEAEMTFDNGNNSINLFVFRMTPKGDTLWSRPIRNMADYDGEIIHWEVDQWHDDVLYLTGQFTDRAFAVAGRDLEKRFPQGIFVLALDLDSGVEQWGYALSSEYTEIHGLDTDASGNVSVMGETSYIQDFEVLGTDSVPGTNLVFQLGLDYNGVPIWHNNAYLEGRTSSPNGSDLEVLRDGEVFASITKSAPDPLLIGGSSVSSKDTYSALLVALNADNTLAGTVMDISGNPVSPGYIKAYKSSRSGAYPYVDSAALDDAGIYQFKGLYPGDYTLLALSDVDKYPNGVPTYVGGAFFWERAQIRHMISDSETTILNITLSEEEKLTPEDGSGDMSGNISFEDDAGLKGTVGKPVTRTSVILVKKAAVKSTQSEDMVAYVETDDLGNYMFGYVPDGEYNLIVDIPGLPMIKTYEVTIVGNTIISGLDFKVGNEWIDTSGSVDVESISMDRFMVFPNPGNGLVHIEFPAGDYRVNIYSSIGKLVDSREYPSAAGLVLMDITYLEEGMYVIQIEGDDASGVLKYMKQ